MAIVTSILTAGANNHLTTSEEANGAYTDFVGQGIVGTVGNTSGVAPATGGFAVNAQGTPDATVAVSAGVAYVTGTPTSQNSQTFRVKNSASANTTISANASGSTKYDWIYITLNATNLNTPNTAGDNVASITVSRSSSASADDGTPPTYGYNIAVVTVANGFSTITNANISDKRAQVILATGSSNPAGGWTATSTPTTVTALGNRSYTVLFPSVDITGTVAKGMRLKCTRTVTAPTQCTDLESGSSQYYSKTSPAGMTFTDDFTVSAWVKMESYTYSAPMSRYSGGSGWRFFIENTGQINLAGFNGGASNYRLVQSYQSIPLNKWVHIAATLDMSGNTGTVYIDGVLVPSAITSSGTNPTALVQAGDLKVGSWDTQYFDGKIAQAAVFSAVLSASTIRSYMSQTLSGSETSLISAYSFNNSINDLSANANNLTANGGAVATNSDTPFTNPVTGTSVTAGTTNYAIVTDATFSTNTTLTVQIPEGEALPTSGGISAVSYSTQKVPYGFPSDGGKWQVTAHSRVQTVQSSPTQNTWYNNGGMAITIPIGVWRARYQAQVYSSKGAAETNIDTTLSTGTTTETDDEFSFQMGAYQTIETGSVKEKILTLTATTTYYLNMRTTTASVGNIQLLSSEAPSVISAELAYL